MLVSIVVLIGVGEQEAFECCCAGVRLLCHAYLALFAIPLLARKELGIRPALWLRLGAVSGLLSLSYTFCSPCFQLWMCKAVGSTPLRPQSDFSAPRYGNCALSVGAKEGFCECECRVGRRRELT